MKKTITAKQAAFLLPLFLLLAVFAIYPIVTSMRLSLFITTNNGMIVTCVGIIIVARKTLSKRSAAGKQSFANAKAAMDDDSSVMSV